MSRYGSTESDRPLAYWRGHPVYAAHFVAVLLGASMLLTTLCAALNATAIWGWLPFDSALVLHGQVWRIFTYGLVNPPSLNFVIDLVMIVWFGREVEKVIGHRRFLFLYGALYLVTPLLFTALGFWRTTQLVGEMGSLAVFVAFATYFPNAAMIFNVLAKWVALIFVGIYVLRGLADHNWTELLSLAATCGFAYAYIRYEQGRIALPRFRIPRRKPKLRVLPDLPAASAQTRKDAASVADIDALLDKIAQSGLSSLTSKERAKLEKRREDLLGKNPPK